MTNKQARAQAREQAEREAYEAGAKDAVKLGLNELLEWCDSGQESIADLRERVGEALARWR